MIRTEKEILIWIKKYLGKIISECVAGTEYSEDWLAAMACRETGFLIQRYVNKDLSFQSICDNMRGDYSSGIYHGFGFWQIDVRSFQDFVQSGDWRNAKLTCLKAISVLDGKKIALNEFKENMEPVYFDRAITAAYNCGQGNVKKSILSGGDVDVHTFNHDYSKEVFRMREVYKSL